MKVATTILIIAAVVSTILGSPLPTTTSGPTNTTSVNAEWTDLPIGLFSLLSNAGTAQATPTPTTTTAINADWTSVGTGPLTPGMERVRRDDEETIDDSGPTCDWWYKVFWYRVHVNNVDTSWAGEDGEDLHNAMKGCGKTTAWHFNTLEDGTYQAKFSLPVVMAQYCVEKAIKRLGGPDIDHCYEHI